VSLGDRLVEKLKGGADGPVEVEADAVKATVDVVGSGPYGSEVRAISIERKAPRGADDAERARRFQQTVDGIAERVNYLPERVVPFETAPSQGRGLLRTPRGQVDGREYYEVTVDGGDRVDVERFRGRDAGGRDRITDNYGHGVLKRLVDDVADLVGDRREAIRSDESLDD